MKNVLKPLAKRVLIPLGLTAATLATDAAIHKKMFGSSRPSNWASRVTTLIVFTINKELDDIIKIVKSFEVSSLLIKGISKTIKNK